MQAIAMDSPPAVDLTAIKGRQQVAWSAGNYAVVGTTLQMVGESLCEALDVRAGQRVLDVAAGNGNATLAAARRGCDVVSTDYVRALLDVGRAGRARYEIHRPRRLPELGSHELPRLFHARHNAGSFDDSHVRFRKQARG